MSQELTIQVSDALYAHLQLHATSQAKSPNELALAAIERQYPMSTDSNTTQPAPTENNAARGLVRKYFGTFDLGRPVGTDNEAIDADLAREYADTHEDS